MLMHKPLSVLDRTANFVLHFPVLSYFIPRFLRVWLIKLVVCLKVYWIGLACCLKQIFARRRLTTPPYSSLLNGHSFGSRQPLAVITGGTTGLGLALCRLLAPKYRLIIIGRDRDRWDEASQLIRRTCGHETKAIFFSVDLSSRTSINEFLEIFIKTFDRLHLLVNNAGVMLTPYEPVGTSGDIERQWAVNFLAPAYLSDRLAPCLRRAAAQDGFARVVNVSSNVLFAASLSPEYFACAGGCNGSPSRYSSHLAYANSKLALSVFTQIYADQERGDRDCVVACSMHPGVIATDLYRHTNVIVRLAMMLSGWVPLIRGRVVLTPEQAAEDLLWTCLSPTIESGGFYDNGVRVELPTVSREVIEAMWTHLERQDIVAAGDGRWS